MPLETRIQHHSTSFNLSSLALIVWLCLFLRIHVFLLNGLCFGCWTVPLNISRGVKRSQVAVSSRCFQALVDLWTPRRGHMVPFGTWSHGIHGKPWEKPTRILWISYGYPTGFSCQQFVRWFVVGIWGLHFLGDLATAKSSQLTFEARPWGNWGCWGTDGNSRRMGEIWAMLVIPFVLKRFHSIPNWRTHSIIFQRGRYTTKQMFIHSTHPYDFSLYSRMMALEVPKKSQPFSQAWCPLATTGTP